MIRADNGSDEIYRCDIETGEITGPVRLPFFGQDSSYDSDVLQTMSNGRLLYLVDGQALIVTAP